MMDNVTSWRNTKILKRASCLIISVLAVMLLYTYSSGSAKVHNGAWGNNTTWYYNTRTKTVTIDCQGRMEDNFSGHGPTIGWGKWYWKAERVVFKKGITCIGGGTFDNFRKMKEVLLPEGLISIRSSVFWNTPKLKKIRFPSSLKKIGGDAFDGSGIDSVSLKHVEKVGKGAFSGTELRHVTIPARTSFGSYAFSSCTDLKSVRIEEGVKTISHSMFLRSGLRTVTIPASVTEIGAYAFYAFSPEEGKLRKVTVRSTRIKKWGKGIFGKARKDLVIQM